jgi:purine-nucleoside phosphorylase
MSGHSSAHYDALSKAADAVAARLGRARVGVVLGTGLSECLDQLERMRFMEYGQIPGMPETQVVGHRGALGFGRCGGIDVLALCGRIHMYEGRPHADVAFPVRLLSLLGVHTLVVTSAVGSLDRTLTPGSLMVVDDHLNLSGQNVLAAEHDERLGSRFPDMTCAYDPEVSEFLLAAARLVGVKVGRGVLAHTLGPSYETPAEAQRAARLGARVLSMSMVPEVLVARQRRMRVAGLGCVTSMAIDPDGRPHTRDRSLVGAAAYAGDVQSVLSGALARMASEPIPEAL